jgi:hypothetical protein
MQSFLQRKNPRKPALLDLLHNRSFAQRTQLSMNMGPFSGTL